MKTYFIEPRCTDLLRRIRFTLIGAALAISAGAEAQTIEDGLVVGEMAGACRILRELIFSVDTLEVSEFVLRVMDAEATRLGWTRLALIERCKEAAWVYADFTGGDGAP